MGQGNKSNNERNLYNHARLSEDSVSDGCKPIPVKCFNRFSALEELDNGENEDNVIIEPVKGEYYNLKIDNLHQPKKKNHSKDTKHPANTMNQKMDNNQDKKSNTNSFLDVCI